MNMLDWKPIETAPFRELPERGAAYPDRFIMVCDANGEARYTASLMKRLSDGAIGFFADAYRPTLWADVPLPIPLKVFCKKCGCTETQGFVSAQPRCTECGWYMTYGESKPASAAA